MKRITFEDKGQDLVSIDVAKETDFLIINKGRLCAISTKRFQNFLNEKFPKTKHSIYIIRSISAHTPLHRLIGRPVDLGTLKEDGRVRMFDFKTELFVKIKYTVEKIEEL